MQLRSKQALITAAGLVAASGLAGPVAHASSHAPASAQGTTTAGAPSAPAKQAPNRQAPAPAQAPAQQPAAAQAGQAQNAQPQAGQAKAAPAQNGAAEGNAAQNGAGENSQAQYAQAPKAAAQPKIVYYNSQSAPSYTGVIDQAAGIWNGSLKNVRMVKTNGPADVYYKEGDFGANGSSTTWTAPGQGTVAIDYSQTAQNSPLRVVTHETGHVIGDLADNYSGPCSDLMSGGGPGPSCTNATPSPAEASLADSRY
ncbi:snapalysin family zinc-dependent metalloprotease [Arthrobacter sp. UM1]|uniref:snapalysin family zinc-dependent metalloprotease n=1 Tax=Arthrobacter sp. UM1 TaxID=2766776 RepID=UPI001CF7182E|nr:snapalysin family zinc-dependent metalloprotease [Arthrobacter sp. UM1]MCB4208565.1 snapalysin family zinc-dependent metalloprotease [Arthrobacter sp. UM1]